MRAGAYVVLALLLSGSIAEAQYAPPVSPPGNAYPPAGPPPTRPVWSPPGSSAAGQPSSRGPAPQFPSASSAAVPPANQPGSASPAPSPGDLPTAIPTRQSSFVIPFSVDESEELPIEVQLFISDDQGASWHLYARQRPSEQQFRFRAVRDGEYWFAPKTVDRNNQVRPAGPPRPELRMVVDTTQPGLQFDARIGRSGEVQTSWEARDTNLVPSTLVVEYQDAAGSRWRPVALDPPAANQPPGAYLGAISWWPETTSRALNVRAEIQDSAGNRTVVNRQVFLPRNRPTPSTPQDPAGSSSTGGRLVSRSGPPRQPGSVPPDPFNRPADTGAVPWPGSSPPEAAPARSSSAADLGAVADDSSASGASAASTDTRWSSSGSSGSGMSGSGMSGSGMSGSGMSGSGTYPGDYPGRVQGNAQTDATTAQWDPRSELVPGRGSAYKPISGPSQLPLAERPAPEAPDAPRQRHFGLPPGERPQVTNRRKFSLEYDVDAVGPAGVAAVELWATTDGGHTWSRWGEDTDRSSPFEVEVETEGVYGFRVVVVGNNGLASQPPRSGDLADIWIAVDGTPPQGRLTSAVYGKAHEAGHLIVQWTVDDDWLAPRPITLLFSGALDGPWTTIASGLPNDGRYVWKVDPRLPRQFYLRMEVRDEAGNVGTYQLSDPISAEGLTPKGRIRGIRP